MVRARSVRDAAALGYPSPASLPLADDVETPRPAKQVAQRALSLYATLFALFAADVPRPIVRAWMAENGLRTDYSVLEERFLNDEKLSEAELNLLSHRVEALNALCWTLRKAATLSPAEYVDDDLDCLFPDIRRGQGIEAFMRVENLRDPATIFISLDLYYVLHWGVVESALKNRPRPGSVDPYVIVERRHGLEWVMSTAHWDDVELDT
jgi:hypothetical protein